MHEDGNRGVVEPLTLDLRHLRCPLPVLRTRKALAALASGSVLIVECTDPLAGIDIPHLIHESGDTLISIATRGDVQIFSIRKRSALASE